MNIGKHTSEGIGKPIQEVTGTKRRLVLTLGVYKWYELEDMMSGGG